jgi:hypothetical protein
MLPIKSNKTFLRGLIVLLFCIWGAVAYQIVETVTRMEADPTSGPKATSDQSGRTFYVYRADLPDPFRRQSGGIVTADSLKKKPRVQTPPWTPPPITLAGILTHPRKTTAVLQCADGSTHFARQGDTLLGARILKIRQGSVAYFYNKRKAEWVLP